MIQNIPDIGMVINLLGSCIDNPLVASKVIKALRLIESNEKEMSKMIPTLAIDGDGIIYINIEFWRKNIKCEDFAKFVLYHEILHHVLGDLVRLKNIEDEKGRIGLEEHSIINLCMDARINAFITAQFQAGLGGNGRFENFAEKYYKPYSFDGLLRPRSKYGRASRFNKLYSLLYAGGYNYSSKSANEFESFEDIYHAVSAMIRREERKEVSTIIFIGNHGIKGIDPKTGKEIKPGSLPEGILQEIGEAILAGKEGGNGSFAMEAVLKEIRENKKLRMDMLKNYAITQKVNHLKSYYPSPRHSRTVIPINPSRRDIMKLAMGIVPITWNNKTTRMNEKEEGAAIYLDLSGSVNAFLPRIVKLILNVKRDISMVYGFSTYIHEHTVEQLKTGKINTDGGTDFTCIAKHIAENNFKKMIIITDGYASCEKYAEKAMWDKVSEGAVILFGGSPEKKNCFSKSKKVKTFLLEEVIR